MPGKTKINIPYTNSNNRLLDEGDIINFAKLNADNHFTGTLTFDTKPGESPQTSYTIQDLYTDVLFTDVSVNSLSDELARHLDENNAQHFTSEDRAVFSQLGVGVLGTGYHNSLKIQAAMPQVENAQTFISLTGNGPGSKITCSSWYFGMDDGTILCTTDGPTSTNWGQLLRHITNNDVHITGDDKTKWNNMADQIAAAQPMLTFDLAPINASANPVFSGGIYTAIRDALWGDIKFSQTTHADSNAVCNEIILDKSLIPVGELKLMSFANRNGGTPALTGSYACIGELEEDGSLVKLGISQNTINQTSAAGFSILDFEGSGIHLSGQKPVYICFCHTGSDWGEGGAKMDWNTKDQVGVRTKNRVATDTVTSVKLNGASYPWCAEIGIACLHQHEITVDALSAPLTIGNLTIDDIGAGTSFTSTGDIVISAPENTTIQNLTIGVSNVHVDGTTIKPAVPDSALSIDCFCSIYVGGPVIDITGEAVNIIGEEEVTIKAKDNNNAYVRVSNYSYSSDTYSGDAGVYIGTDNWVNSSINLHGHYDENGYSDIFKLQSVFVAGPYIDVTTNRVKYTPNGSGNNTVELTFSGDQPSSTPNGTFKVTAPTGILELSGATTSLSSNTVTMNQSTGYRSGGGTILNSTTMVKASLFMSPDDDLAFPHYKITMQGGVDRNTFIDTRYTNIYAGAVYEEFSGLYHKDEVQTVFNTPVTTFGWDHNPGQPSTIDTYFGASFSAGAHSYIDPTLPSTTLAWFGSKNLPTLIRGSEINFNGAEGVQFTYLPHNSSINDNTGSNNLVSAKQVYQFVSAFGVGPVIGNAFNMKTSESGAKVAISTFNANSLSVEGPILYNSDGNAVYYGKPYIILEEYDSSIDVNYQLMSGDDIIESYLYPGGFRGNSLVALAAIINESSKYLTAKLLSYDKLLIRGKNNNTDVSGYKFYSAKSNTKYSFYIDGPACVYNDGPFIALGGIEDSDYNKAASLTLATRDKVYIVQNNFADNPWLNGTMAISFDNVNRRVEMVPYEDVYYSNETVKGGFDLLGDLHVTKGSITAAGLPVPGKYEVAEMPVIRQMSKTLTGTAINSATTLLPDGSVTTSTRSSNVIDMLPGRITYCKLGISDTRACTLSFNPKTNGTGDVESVIGSSICYVYLDEYASGMSLSITNNDTAGSVYFENGMPTADGARYIFEVHAVNHDIMVKYTRFTAN